MIEVTTKLYNAEEVEAWTEFLRDLVKNRQRVEKAAARTVAEAEAQQEVVVAATPVADVVPAATPASELPQVLSTAPIAKSLIGEQDVVARLREFVNSKGLPAAREILTKFGANRVADLSADKYAEVYAALAL